MASKLFGLVFLVVSVSSVYSFYYQQQPLQTQAMAPAAAVLFTTQESSPYALFAERSDNIYSGDQQAQPSTEWQQFQQQYPDQAAAAAMILSQATAPNSRMVENTEDICQGGFVEHCLVQANQDGEQRLLEMGANNQTGSDPNRESLSSEFDGMCQVVVRFIDCINMHHVRCNPGNGQSLQESLQTDVFYNAWTNMCAGDSKIRNKYLQHAKCIKHALSHNNGQDQCQALFQNYFFSSQMNMDSIESTVQYGCCAFNEWQYCIDSLIQKQCGSDATRAIQDLIDQASGGLVSSLCEKKVFGRKAKACIGKKNYNYSKLHTLSPRMNATLQKYISIFGDFIDRLPDDDDDETSGSN